MQTQSEQATEVRSQASEWAARSDSPKRSVFENYRAGGAPVSGPACSEGRPQRAGSEIGAPLQESIDLAIARSFIHRFLAKAYEDPLPEGWQWLCDARTQTSLRAAWDVVQGRTGVAPVANLIEQNCLEGISKDGERRDACPTFKSEAFDSFYSSYLAAFGHAARGSCPLNEIEYGDLKADPLFQPHRLADLAAFYRAFGLEVADDASERHDHICIELEFMSVLAAKEAYALEHQADEDQLEICRGAQKKFLREHLGRWAPAFARRLRDEAGDGPLAALADLLRQFVLDECTRFGATPGGEDLLLRPVDEATESMCASCGLAGLPPGATVAPAQA